MTQKYAGSAPTSNGRHIFTSAAGSNNSSLAAPPSLPTSPTPGQASPLANIFTTSPSPQPPIGMPGAQNMYGAVPGLGGNANQIAPMRRGRPTKATASEDMQLLPERQVRTGMAALGGGGSGGFGSGAEDSGATGSWEAFGGLGSPEDGGATSAGSDAAAAAAANGFADAFAPTSPVHATSPRFPEVKQPEASLETSVQLPKNIAMFTELSKSTSHESKPENTAAHDHDEERQRFESTFPDINSDLALLAPASTPDARATTSPSNQRAAIPPLARAKSTADLPESLVDVNEPTAPSAAAVEAETNNMPAQLSGERGDTEAGPPLPRRPGSAASSVRSPTAAKGERPLPNPKPTLVSRGSQTSPRLMADWKPLPASGLGTSTSTSDYKEPSPASAGATASDSRKASSLRQSSIPDLELFPAMQPDVRGETVDQDRKPAVDLLSDDVEDDGVTDGTLGQGTDSFVPMQSKPSAGPPEKLGDRTSSTGSVASKRTSYLVSAQSPETASSSGRSLPGSPSLGGGGEREKFRPLKRTSLGQAGAGGPPPPVTLPKPTSSTSPLPSVGPSDLQDPASVEARFPDLTLTGSAGAEARASKVAPSAEKWDEVVEKDEAADSSSSDEDGESVQHASRQSSTKVPTPSFDEDDAPTPQQVSSSAARPRFGANLAATGSPAAPAPGASPASHPGSHEVVSAPGTESRQHSFASTSSEGGGGGIDLGPALASIHRFAPQGNQPSFGNEAMRASPRPMSPNSHHPQLSPPVQQQPGKSRSGSINSLVSRYEGRGLTGGPPPLGAKPVGLRKNSGSASLDSDSNSPLLRRDPVQPQKLPQWSTSAGGRHSPAPSLPSIRSPTLEGREENSGIPEQGADVAGRAASPAPSLVAKPATPTMADRQPFKPVPPPGSPAGARNAGGYGHAARPSFGGSRPPAASSGVPAGAAPARPANAGIDEQEERFAGVSNMKSRWESMAKARDEDVQAARTRPRREHAAI